MKSLKKAPSSTLRWWGLQSAEAFDFVSTFLNGQSFDGPTIWAEGALVPYSKALCPTIKAVVSVSTFTADNGYAAFDAGAVLLSKTLHDLLRKANPDEEVPRQRIHAGFAPCLTISLAHLKWCQNPSDINPSWAMTLQADASRPGAQVFAEDFTSLMLPMLEGLKSDDDLEALLVRALKREKPTWVGSDTPWFARLPERVALLKKRGTAARRLIGASFKKVS
ncbi:hypothetical protein [Rhizobacter sp. OV335]|jgi:hypothetical protein|uniref:hypothetical protein n=1 Tax=Rhizobacter sp. OV335 TaxID=1500264 RepID=UPI000918896C|nr:hypothetical protein [Rhizobacter sp. OV335]SHN20537.1 hypothetical protein SAMN02787076_04033 [Rhizobacter sp. OV335]